PSGQPLDERPSTGGIPGHGLRRRAAAGGRLRARVDAGDARRAADALYGLPRDHRRDPRAVRHHAGADRSGLLADCPRRTVRRALAEWHAASLAVRPRRALALLARGAPTAHATAERRRTDKARPRAG